MSIRQNGKTIAGATQYHPDLFDWKWADHQLDDVQWLRADTFSWQSGAVYESAYQHLVDDIDGKTAQTETVAGITISFYLADDKHKITTDESAVAQIYAATGVAWYYVLDTTNQRFKLPRTKFGVTGFRDAVGNYVAPGLPAPTSTFSMWVGGGGTYNGFVGNTYSAAGTRNVTANTDNIYGQSTTVQPPATQMCLYFYVGNFTQTALENTAGLNASLFNGKADIDLDNINPSSNAKQTIAGWAFPDYASAVSRSVNVDYSETSNGYLVVSATTVSGAGTFKVKIGNTTYNFYQGYTGTDYDHPSVGFIPLGKGTPYKITTMTNALSAVFIPCIGG